ncbi:MAG: DoxX family protein [Actinomycetia bacterium]|nr:DoxX family protein [Actinomycetes bacterium]
MEGSSAVSSQGEETQPGRRFSRTFDAPVAPFVLVVRLVMGWIFIWAGFDKVLGGFTAEGFLLHATSGPLPGWFNDLGADATALSVIDPLVAYGQVPMGLCLFFGAFTRLVLLFAAVMTFLFYIAQFPPEHDLFVDYYIVYIVA